MSFWGNIIMLLFYSLISQMKIQQKHGYILISTSESKVMLGDNIKCKTEDADIFIASSIELKGDSSGKLLINNPGEFEAHGVMVQAVPGPGSDKIQFFSVDAEGINIIFIESSAKNLAKKSLEQIGENNILITQVGDNLENLREYVDDFDPNILLPLTAKSEEYVEIAKRLGVLLTEPIKNLTITADDFDSGEEEKPLQLIILEA